MMLFSAFLLGLVGSLHCAGMCGPLVLALPTGSSSRAQALAGRLAYNTGRLMTYSVIGSLLGWVGQTMVLIGLQRWISAIAGLAILSGLLTSSRFVLGGPIPRAVTALKMSLGRLLRQRGVIPQWGFGMLNGLLPCGLVYAAAAAATTAGTIVDGLLYMVAFGLGTFPMMLAVGALGSPTSTALRFRLQKLVPYSLGLVGTLLILRGLALGIPFLSPDLATGTPCH